MDADSGSHRARTQPAAASAHGTTVLAFGPFRLDGKRRLLTANGREVALQPRAFDLLELFVSCGGQVLSNDEIVGHVWRGTAVGDNNLGVQLSALRRVLAEHGGKGLIVTVPGRGYRFIGDVVQEMPPSASALGVRSALSRERGQFPRRRRLHIGIAVTAVLVVVVGLTALESRPSSPPPKPPVAALAEPFNPPPHSVAVLAFTNFSNDPNQEYLSDGLSDELIDSLSRLRDLRVVARTSSFYFKGKSATIDEIAHRLNVGAILEGSIRRIGSMLRVTAHLTDATTGYELWSNSYDREQGDILAIQRDIAEAVAISLKAALTANDLPKLSLGGTTNPKAFDAYLRGVRSFSATPGEAGDRNAIAAFDEAIALDPNFASARAVRALTLADLVEFGGEPNVSKAMRMLDDALSETNRATAIAPELGWAYMARATVKLGRSLDFSGAAADYARARTLSPDHPRITRHYALFEIYLGHLATGAVAAERAVLLDPLDPFSRLNLAEVYYFARRYADALTALHQAEALGEPGPTRGRGLGGLINLVSGNAGDGYRKCAPGHDLIAAECTIIALHAIGKLSEAEAALSKLRAMAGDMGAYNYAEIYAQWGQQGEAIHWLSRSFELRDNGLLFLKVDPLLDPIRDTKEYKDVERRMNFPP